MLLIGWNFLSTNQKHYQNLGSDASPVWNFCARCSDVILRGLKWRPRKTTAVFSSCPEGIQNSAVLFHTKKLHRTSKGKSFQRNCLFSFSFKSFQPFESNVLSHCLYSCFTSRLNIAHNACGHYGKIWPQVLANHSMHYIATVYKLKPSNN